MFVQTVNVSSYEPLGTWTRQNWSVITQCHYTGDPRYSRGLRSSNEPRILKPQITRTIPTQRTISFSNPCYIFSKKTANKRGKKDILVSNCKPRITKIVFPLWSLTIDDDGFKDRLFWLQQQKLNFLIKKYFMPILEKKIKVFN